MSGCPRQLSTVVFNVFEYVDVQDRVKKLASQQITS